MKSSTKDQARGSEPSHTTFLASEMRKCAAPGFRGLGRHRGPPTVGACCQKYGSRPMTSSMVANPDGGRTVTFQCGLR